MQFLKVSFESVPSCIRRRFSRPPTSHPPASAHPSTRPRHRPTARPPARPPVRAAGHDRPARPPTPTARPTHRAGQPPTHPGGGYHHGRTIYGKMDLEKLITTNPISHFFTETFDLLSARPFENLVREGVYRFHLFTIKLFFLGGFQPPRPLGGGPAAPRAPLRTERLRLSGSP